MASCMVIDPSEPEGTRAYFSLSELLQAQKTFFSDLLSQYQPLLAEINDSESSAEKGVNRTKESMKQMFMGGSMKLKGDILKLSDFIDESFFEDEIQDEVDTHRSKEGLREVRDLVNDLRQQIGSHVLIQTGSKELGGKRLKTG